MTDVYEGAVKAQKLPLTEEDAQRCAAILQEGGEDSLAKHYLRPMQPVDFTTFEVKRDPFNLLGDMRRDVLAVLREVHEVRQEIFALKTVVSAMHYRSIKPSLWRRLSLRWKAFTRREEDYCDE